MIVSSFLLTAGLAVLMFASTPSEAYVSHSPILITSDAEFDGDHGVTSGDGSEGSPWVISNWDISGDASHAIEVRDTTDYFVIRGVYLHSSVSWNDKSGVYLLNVANGCVESSLIQGDFNYGIYMRNCNRTTALSNNITDTDYLSGMCAEYSSDVTVSGNTLSNCGYSVRLYEVEGCEVANNNVTDSLGYLGIQIFDTCNATVRGNNVSTVNEGMQIAGSKSTNVTITENTVLNCTQGGIGVYTDTDTSMITVSDNYLENTGVTLQQCVGVRVLDNHFENMSSTYAIYLNRALNSVIQGNEMLSTGIVVWGNTLEEYSSHTISSDNTVNGKPVRFLKNSTGCSLDGEDTGQLIFANYSGGDVANLEIVGGHWAVGVYYSENIAIRDCNLSDNSRIGIEIRNSKNTTVAGCELNNMDFIGVYSSGYMVNATFANNTISGNGWNGMKIWYATQVNISGNLILSNGIPNNQAGIELYQCNWGNITENHIADNYVGIYLSTNTRNFDIYHNNFVNNVVQAIDVMSNSWDDGYPSGGNYWDNYTYGDGDGDGIGDTPFVIDPDSQDNYPLMAPIPEFTDALAPALAIMGMMVLFLRMRPRERSGSRRP